MRYGRLRAGLAGGIAMAALAACSEATEPAALDAPAAVETASTGNSCSALAELALEDTVIVSSGLVEAGALELPSAPGARPVDTSSLPEFCRVAGSIRPTEESDIYFEAWLPLGDSWNGRFMQVGNGGAAGAVVYSSMTAPLTRGYAVVNTDTGHRGTMGDFSWALGEEERLTDYQYRAVRETTLKGKDITEAFYGAAPDASYWFGCSTGGRQGLVEAQRYPDDYDAIIAGAPANNWPPLQLSSIHFLNNLNDDRLPVSQLGLLKDAAIAECDGLDGLSDGIISNLAECPFDPASLACVEGDEPASCLSPSAVEAARSLYAGIITSDGTVAMPGPGYGSESEWAAYVTPFFRIGTSYMQNVVLEDPDWDPATMDIDTHLAMLVEHDQGRTTAMDPDLSAFVDNGGLLLLYHGMADGIIPHDNTLNYYQSVVETLGEDVAGEHVRFFSVPGMGHCAGGDGASAIDWISAIENWDQSGVAPALIEATHPEEGFTRPICEHPYTVTYNGEGPEDDATSFMCEAP